MDTARKTDERLRSALNGNQPSRERMCIAVLTIDRKYTEILPRRPEGGPDGGRDIQCLRNSQTCFGAVGFVNSVSDSPSDKQWTKKKFKDDLRAAKGAEPTLHAFVFFTNIDLTPTEVEQLKHWGEAEGVDLIDIYWRERIRMALDSPEGLAIRYQYLSIPLSEAEQASFFSRFGTDIERLIRGRFDSIERKIDHLEFTHWKNGDLRELSLELELRRKEESRRTEPEHFRIALELQSVVDEGRSIIIGGQDDFLRIDGGWCFGVKTCFWRQKAPQTDVIWAPRGVRACGGIITAIRLGIRWFPRSPVLVSELEGLFPYLYVTENLRDRLASVQLIADSYVLYNSKIEPEDWVQGNPNLAWPSKLTPEELRVEWLCKKRGPTDFLNLERNSPKMR